MKESREARFVFWLRQQPKGVIHSLARAFLLISSIGYGWGMALRSWLYDHHHLPTHRLRIPVISVGNLVAGGSGKTPVVLLLLQSLRNHALAVASRGYRSQAEKSSLPVSLKGKELSTESAKHYGDEPVLIARRFPEVEVYAGKNRITAGEWAEKAGADCLILDDGFQHRKLHRDLDIVVMDAREPWGLGYLLPRGFLREEPQALKRASLIVITHSPEQEDRQQALQKQLQRYTSAPIVWTKLQISQIATFDGKKIDSLEGKRVGLFSGIAKPDSFRKTVEQSGAIVVETMELADHCAPTLKKMKTFQKLCKDKEVQYILCTEKDFARGVPSFEENPQMGWVQVDLTILRGEEDWKGTMENLIF